MITEHQIGLVKAITRSAAGEYVVERYAEKIAELVAANLKSNDELYEILGKVDTWGDAKTALKLLKGEKVCISDVKRAGAVARTTCR